MLGAHGAGITVVHILAVAVLVPILSEQPGQAADIELVGPLNGASAWVKLQGSVVRLDEPPRAKRHTHRLRHNAVVDELVDLRAEAIVADR